MVDVTLVPMTSRDLDLFVDEQIADYADERVIEGSWSRCEALGEARLALHTVIAWEHQAATDLQQRLWTAIDADGQCVGWLWVKLAPPGPAHGHAFLCQLTVTRGFRGRGVGRAMLAALEASLNDEGVTELDLNVCEANLSAKRLYAQAGFEVAAQCPTMRKLRKHLNQACQPTAAVDPALPASRTPP